MQIFAFVFLLASLYRDASTNFQCGLYRQWGYDDTVLGMAVCSERVRESNAWGVNGVGREVERGWRRVKNKHKMPITHIINSTTEQYQFLLHPI